MGLFSELGRSVEQFKRTVESTAEETAEFACRACGTRLHADHETCPECGADAVRERETEDAED